LTCGFLALPAGQRSIVPITPAAVRSGGAGRALAANTDNADKQIAMNTA